MWTAVKPQVAQATNESYYYYFIDSAAYSDAVPLFDVTLLSLFIPVFILSFMISYLIASKVLCRWDEPCVLDFYESSAYIADNYCQKVVRILAQGADSSVALAAVLEEVSVESDEVQVLFRDAVAIHFLVESMRVHEQKYNSGAKFWIADIIRLFQLLTFCYFGIGSMGFRLDGWMLLCASKPDFLSLWIALILQLILYLCHKFGVVVPRQHSEVWKDLEDLFQVFAAEVQQDVIVPEKLYVQNPYRTAGMVHWFQGPDKFTMELDSVRKLIQACQADEVKPEVGVTDALVTYTGDMKSCYSAKIVNTDGSILGWISRVRFEDQTYWVTPKHVADLAGDALIKKWNWKVGTKSGVNCFKDLYRCDYTVFPEHDTVVFGPEEDNSYLTNLATATGVSMMNVGYGTKLTEGFGYWMAEGNMLKSVGDISYDDKLPYVVSHKLSTIPGAGASGMLINSGDIKPKAFYMHLGGNAGSEINYAVRLAPLLMTIDPVFVTEEHGRKGRPRKHNDPNWDAKHDYPSSSTDGYSRRERDDDFLYEDQYDDWEDSMASIYMGRRDHFNIGTEPMVYGDSSDLSSYGVRAGVPRVTHTRRVNKGQGNVLERVEVNIVTPKILKETKDIEKHIKHLKKVKAEVQKSVELRRKDAKTRLQDKIAKDGILKAADRNTKTGGRSYEGKNSRFHVPQWYADYAREFIFKKPDGGRYTSREWDDYLSNVLSEGWDKLLKAWIISYDSNNFDKNPSSETYQWFTPTQAMVNNGLTEPIPIGLMYSRKSNDIVEMEPLGSGNPQVIPKYNKPTEDMFGDDDETQNEAGDKVVAWPPVVHAALKTADVPEAEVVTPQIDNLNAEINSSQLKTESEEDKIQKQKNQIAELIVLIDEISEFDKDHKKFCDELNSASLSKANTIAQKCFTMRSYFRQLNFYLNGHEKEKYYLLEDFVTFAINIAAERQVQLEKVKESQKTHLELLKLKKETVLNDLGEIKDMLINLSNAGIEKSKMNEELAKIESLRKRLREITGADMAMPENGVALLLEVTKMLEIRANKWKMIQETLNLLAQDQPGLSSSLPVETLEQNTIIPQKSLSLTRSQKKKQKKLDTTTSGLGRPGNQLPSTGPAKDTSTTPQTKNTLDKVSLKLTTTSDPLKAVLVNEQA
jgi:hypothetical protein